MNKETAAMRAAADAFFAKNPDLDRQTTSLEFRGSDEAGWSVSGYEIRDPSGVVVYAVGRTGPIDLVSVETWGRPGARIALPDEAIAAGAAAGESFYWDAGAFDIGATGSCCCNGCAGEGLCDREGVQPDE